MVKPRDGNLYIYVRKSSTLSKRNLFKYNLRGITYVKLKKRYYLDYSQDKECFSVFI